MLLLQFIKVQIRKDLALDASVTPADKTLSALLAQSATPVAPPSTQSTLTSHSSQTHTALVEIPNKTVVFPATLTGETTGGNDDLKAAAFGFSKAPSVRFWTKSTC